MAQEKAVNPIFAEAKEIFDKAQHEVAVEMTATAYRALYEEQQALKAVMADFQKELDKIDAKIEDLKTNGVQI